MALKHRDQFHRNITLWDEITNLYANLSGDEVKLPLDTNTGEYLNFICIQFNQLLIHGRILGNIRW